MTHVFDLDCEVQCIYFIAREKTSDIHSLYCAQIKTIKKLLCFTQVWLFRRLVCEKGYVEGFIICRDL